MTASGVGYAVQRGEVIVLKENETLEYEDLMAFCEKRMAYFMIPRYVEFREFTQDSYGQQGRKI